MTKEKNDNNWLRTFIWFFIFWIIAVTYCPMHAQIKVQADKFTASQGIATGTLTDGTKFVGAIDAPDYMDYSVNIPANGSYSVAFRVSSGAIATLLFKQGSTILTTVQIPNQFDYNKYITMTTTINLSFGTQTFRIATTTGGFNINYFTITPINVVPPVVTPPPTTGTYTKAQVDSIFNSLLDIQFSGDTLRFPTLRKLIKTISY